MVSKYCYCHERYTMSLKIDEEITKAILDFIKTEIAGAEYKTV